MYIRISIAVTIATVIGALASRLFLPTPALAGPPQGEQYKIVSIMNFGRGDDNAALEAELNRLAADGWRVRAGVMHDVILAK